MPRLLAILLTLLPLAAFADEDSNPCLHPRTRTEVAECTVAPAARNEARTCAQLPSSEAALQALAGSLSPSYTGRCRMREVCEDCGKVIRYFGHGVQARAAGLPSASLDGHLSASRILPGAYTFSYTVSCHAEQPASATVVFAAYTETDRLDADRSLDCLMDFRLDTDAAHTLVRTMTPHVPLGYALRLAPLRPSTRIAFTATPTTGSWPSGSPPELDGIAEEELTPDDLARIAAWRFPQWGLSCQDPAHQSHASLQPWSSAAYDGQASAEFPPPAPGVFTITASCGDEASPPDSLDNRGRRTRRVVVLDADPAPATGVPILTLDDDDDDRDGHEDRLQEVPTAGDDDLLRINPSLDFGLVNAPVLDDELRGLLRFRLSASEALRLWQRTAGTGDPLAAIAPSEVFTWAELAAMELCVQGVAEGDAELALVILPAPGSGGSGSLAVTRPLRVIRAALVPDFDRDRAIGDADRDAVAAGQTFRFWVNEDAWDNDYLTAGYKRVGGLADLLDFFPLLLDASGLPGEAPDGSAYEYAFRLANAGSAFNCAYTSLLPQDAGAFLVRRENKYGSELNQDPLLAATIQIDAAGLLLPPAFSGRIRAGNAVLMCEAVAATAQPLELRVYANGRLAGVRKLHLRVSPVAQMFRSVDLRPCLANLQPMEQILIPSEPPNLPDDDPEAAGPDVFFAHGFNVTASEAAGWNADIFKRLWQAGTRMRFWGVDWPGDAGEWYNRPLRYYTDVKNALVVAEAYAALVNRPVMRPRKILLAHSLGNMLTMSALVNFGATAEKFIMVNAAVPAEAFDPASHDCADSNPLVHEDWHGYFSRTRSAHWHNLFEMAPDDPDDPHDPLDHRARMTWRWRAVQPMLPEHTYTPAVEIHNFYSSEDEVLMLNDSGVGLFNGIFSSLGAYAWHKQEYRKGREGEDFINALSTEFAGWSFHRDQNGNLYYNKNQANDLSDLQLSDPDQTVFKFGPAALNNPSATFNDLAEILASYIPALSAPMGFVQGFAIQEQTCNMAQDCKSNEVSAQWTHSAWREFAFFHSFCLFFELRNLINP